VIPFDDEAIAAANDTEYGLAGSIWTENLGRAHRVVNELRGGQIWVNAADPSMPICGHEQSGWGTGVAARMASRLTSTQPLMGSGGETRDLDRSVRIPRAVHDLVNDVIIPSLTRHNA
jgi:acyl-CoA reductase-like NAD-dependent aldehyde dehydrogenase